MQDAMEKYRVFQQGRFAIDFPGECGIMVSANLYGKFYREHTEGEVVHDHHTEKTY